MRVSKLKNYYWLPVSIGLILRLIRLNSPVLGIHSWRQADTAAMARHFAENNTPLWLPQIDWSGAGTGLVECEFPIYQYLLGKIYQIFGVQEWLGRGLSTIFSVLTIWLIIRISKKLLDNQSAWWGGLFFAMMPLNVYYGRTVQGESLMLMLAALSIDSILTWNKERNRSFLLISWISFTTASLIKVLPFIWTGLPLILIIAKGRNLKSSYQVKDIKKDLVDIGRSTSIYLYMGLTLILMFTWYLYAYRVGEYSGLSFGFWGESSDRSSITLISDLSIWSNLLLRVTVRNFSIFGLPLFVIGLINARKDYSLKIIFAGLIGILICTLLAIRASSIHEYYQLPLQLFICPLMGKGLVVMKNWLSNNFITQTFTIGIVSLIAIVSLLVLKFDYWNIESRQVKIWMPLAQNIREKVPVESKIVSVTGGDPTLLNLGRRQGWLTTAAEINQMKLKSWLSEGGEYIVGNFNWAETHESIESQETIKSMKKMMCSKELSKFCLGANYLVPIKNLIK